MPGRYTRHVLDSQGKSTQVVATALAFAASGGPTKADEIERRPAEERCPHRDVPPRIRSVALVKVVSSQSRKTGPLHQTSQKTFNRVWRELDVVVKEHEPGLGAHLLSVISRSGNCLPPACIIGQRLANDLMELSLHPPRFGDRLQDRAIRRASRP